MSNFSESTQKMESHFRIYHEYATLREELGSSRAYGHRNYNPHEEIMREFTKSLNLGWIAKWCQDWAPIVAPQKGYDTRPEISLFMEMTENGNLRISWAPAISYDQYYEAPREFQIWLEDLRSKEAFQSPKNEIYFIRDMRKIESFLNCGSRISDHELSLIAIKALDEVISDLPRKIKHIAKAYWQDYLFIDHPDGTADTQGRFELIGAWDYYGDRIENKINSLEAKTQFTEPTLDAAIGEISQKRPRITRVENKIKAIAKERGLCEIELQSLHAQYEQRDKFNKTVSEERFCRENHPGRWSRRH